MTLEDVVMEIQKRMDSITPSIDGSTALAYDELKDLMAWVNTRLEEQGAVVTGNAR